MSVPAYWQPTWSVTDHARDLTWINPGVLYTERIIIPSAEIPARCLLISHTPNRVLVARGDGHGRPPKSICRSPNYGFDRAPRLVDTANLDVRQFDQCGSRPKSVAADRWGLNNPVLGGVFCPRVGRNGASARLASFSCSKLRQADERFTRSWSEPEPLSRIARALAASHLPKDLMAAMRAHWLLPP